MGNPASRKTDNGEDHSRQRHWYFEKRISMDTIVGLLGIAIVLGGPLVLWGRAMEANLVQTQSRVTLLETSSDQRAKFDTEREVAGRERQREVAIKVEKLDDKFTAGQSKIVEQMQLLQISVGQLLAKPR